MENSRLVRWDEGWRIPLRIAYIGIANPLQAIQTGRQGAARVVRFRYGSFM
jgi:hypothetical protein